MREHTQEQLIKEIMWENHQIEEGVRKYREALEDKTLDGTKGGMRLLQEAMPHTVAGIKKAYKEAEATLLSGKAGNQPNWMFLIGMVSAEQAAAITINKVMAHIQTNKGTQGSYGQKQMSLTGVAKLVGQALRQQLMFENWKKNEKIKLKEHNETADIDDQYSKSYAEQLIERARGNVTRPKLARWKAKFETYQNIEWGQDEVVIGMKLIEVLISTNPNIFTYKMISIKGKRTRLLEFTDEAWATITQCNDSAELQSPLLLPTLIEPKEWCYEDGKVVGGYHHMQQPLFTKKLSAHTAADVNAPSQRFLESINKVQETAWSINPYILMVVDMIIGTDKALGGVPRMCELQAPKLDKETFEALTKEERTKFLTKQAGIREDIASQRGRHSAFVRKVAIARKMLTHDRFYFPHFADFRGRLYPMPAELAPQGDQVAKGLLQFAEKRELGESGLFWLKVHIANTFGNDKDSLKDRAKWAEDNINMLADCVIDPLNNTEWAGADAPLPFLAAAYDLVNAYELSDPTQYESHIAVAMDGTCNGMQLLSLLGRDNLGAEKTNCRHFNERFDLYSEVATKVIEICKRETTNNATAEEWYKRLHNNPSKARKTVKRAVMTTPYGVTGRGIAQQLVNDRHCNDLGQVSRATASDYMKECILEAMSEVNGKAVEIMGYFQNVAGALASTEQPLSWYTPMGLKVTQAYYKMADKRVQTVFGTVILWAEDHEMGLDSQKQFQSAAPNVIHSFDAAMLQLTVENLAKKGHTDFAMIHDSYGMHAGSIAELHATLREAAYEIFSTDNLAEFHEYTQAQTDTVLPTLPTQGDYDIAEILRAPYFFS